MLIDQPVPNFLGGVSQQPPLSRFQNQLNEQVNCVSDIVEGLRKRPPTEHIARIITGNLAQRPAVFLIDRDRASRYLAVVAGGIVRVFDLFTGAEKTVTGGTDSYFQTTGDPAENLRALTVADYTFLLNREKTVTQLANTNSATRPFESLLFFRAGNYGRTYSVTVKTLAGAVIATASVSTPDGSTAAHAAQVATDVIATGILSSFSVAMNAAGFAVDRVGSLIYISRNTDYTIDVEDGQGKQSLRVFKGEVQRFTDLPQDVPTAFNGFTLKVTGDQSSQFDDYWVKFNGKTWEETIQPGIPLRLDPASMPRGLVRNTNDTFSVVSLPWVDRMVGDEEGNPFPSFIEGKLRALLYVGDRLGFLADENVILSASGDYFNFFRTTMTSLLATDPIDTPAPTTSGDASAVSLLEHAVAFNNRVALFADNAQFILTSEGALSPQSARIEPATALAADSKCRPIPLGPNVIFTFDREGATGFREMFVDGAARIDDALDITAHVPKYVPSGIRQLSANTLENILVAVGASGNKLYVYDYFLDSNREKVQSAWGRWEFNTGDDVISYHFVDNSGYLVVKRSDGFHLERMRFLPGLTDTSLSYYTLLDRRVTPSAAYDSITDRTTFTVPWPVTADMQIVTRYSASALHAPGDQVPIITGAGYAVQVAGNKTAWSVVAGVPYTQQFDLTRPYVISSSTNGTVANTEINLVMKDFSLDYAGTGYFVATFKPKGRASYSKTFTGNVLGATPTDVPALSEGKFRMKTPTSNKYWDLTIENNSPFPSRFLSGSWRGIAETKSRRV